MQSFILASKNNEQGLSQAIRLCEEKGIEKFDLHIETFEKAVGIESVRNLIKNIYLKPLQGREKALIINAPFGLTTEAQNSLLKILEEPPKNTDIIIVVETSSVLLPTILSRCKVITVKKDLEIIDEKKLSEFKKLLEELGEKESGISFKIAQDFGKDRNEAILFLEKNIILARNLLLSEANILNSEKTLTHLTEVVNKFEKGRQILKTSNVSPRFVLENTLLSISH